MARRGLMTFDASFSRRPQHFNNQGRMNENNAHGEFPRGGGGGGAYNNEEDEQFGARSGSGAYEDEYEQEFDRVPRDGGRGSAYSTDGGGGGGGGGGWRQRSPSPRDRGDRDTRGGRRDRDTRNAPGGGGGGGGGPTWTTRGGSDNYANEGRGGGSSNYQQSSSNTGGMMSMPSPQQQQQQRPPSLFGTPPNMMRNPEQQPVVMVLPSNQTPGGLMGNLGLNANPFAMGVQPLVVGGLPAFSNPQAFGQQLLQQTAPQFGVGVGTPSSLYGPQTQQGFSRPRNLITAPDNGGRRRGDRDRGRRGDSDRNWNEPRNDSRKRNLVLRDPRPEDTKKARVSEDSKRRVESPSKVKRVSLELEKDKKSDRKSSGTKKHEDKVKIKKEEEGQTNTKSSNKKQTEEKEGKKSTAYDGLEGGLVCKVCQKVMNDGQSFESHLSGKAHQSLLNLLENRFEKRSELLMCESKCSEDEIGIEMDRQRRAGASKSGRAEKTPNNFCKMCDAYYAANWGSHKVSVGHRVLKEFLHPTCHICKVHFMHRKDWVLHLLTPGHFKKVQEVKKEGRVSVESFESPNQDELFTVYVDLNREDRLPSIITVKPLDGREPLTEEMKDILKNDRGEIVLPEGEIPLPKEYNKEITVGADAVVPVNGNRCRVCRVYIAEDKSIEEHCGSKEHFNQYVSFLKRVNRHREHKEKERKQAEEKAKREEERKKRRAEEKAKAESEKAKAESEKAVAAINGEATADEIKGEVKTESVKIENEEDTEKDEDVKMKEEEGQEFEHQKDDANVSITIEYTGPSIVTVEEVDLEGNGEAEDEEKVQPAEENMEETTDPEELQDDNVDDGKKDNSFEDLPIITSVAGGIENPVLNNETQIENQEAETMAITQEHTDEVVKDDEDEEEAKHEDEDAEEVEMEVQAKAAPMKNRGRVGRGVGSGPIAGRGRPPAIKNVTAKVDTNIRGRGSGRGTRATGRGSRGYRGAR